MIDAFSIKLYVILPSQSKLIFNLLKKKKHAVIFKKVVQYEKYHKRLRLKYLY